MLQSTRTSPPAGNSSSRATTCRGSQFAQNLFEGLEQTNSAISSDRGDEICANSVLGLATKRLPGGHRQLLLFLRFSTSYQHQGQLQRAFPLHYSGTSHTQVLFLSPSSEVSQRQTLALPRPRLPASSSNSYALEAVEAVPLQLESSSSQQLRNQQPYGVIRPHKVSNVQANKPQQM